MYLFLYSLCLILLWNSIFLYLHFSRVRNLYQKVLRNKSKRKDFPISVKRFQNPKPLSHMGKRLMSVKVYGRMYVCLVLFLLDRNLSTFSPYLQPLCFFATLLNMFKMLPTPKVIKKTKQNKNSSASTTPLPITPSLLSLLNQTA